MIVGGTTLAVGGTGLALATGDARADAHIDLGTLKAVDAEFTASDRALANVYLLLSGRWAYRGLDTAAAEWTAMAIVGDGSGNTAAIGSTSGDASGTEDSGTYGLRANLMDAGFYSTETFTIPDGEDSISVTVPVEAALVLKDADGGLLRQARVSDTAVVTVVPGGTMANLAGEATFQAQDDSDDETPTPPGGG